MPTTATMPWESDQGGHGDRDREGQHDHQHDHQEQQPSSSSQSKQPQSVLSPADSDQSYFPLDSQQSRQSHQPKHSLVSQASDTTREGAPAKDQHHQQRSKHHQKHVVGGGAGRLHGRNPSSKALHKYHGSTASKLNHRRHASSSSPDPSARTTTPSSHSHGHRRTQSEAKLLSRDSSSSNLHIRRNKSHVEVHKRTKSSDKLKRTSSNPAVNKHKPAKSTVHFDLGSDGPDDEWVDASGSASPYLSRRGSMASGQSSTAKPGGSSAPGSRPHTPGGPTSPPRVSTPDRQRTERKEYLTSRLLQRTPSYGAPPQMTADHVSVSRGRSPESPSRRRPSNSGEEQPGTPSSTAHNDTISNQVITGSSGGGDELTSRFVGVASSGNANESSFPTPNVSRPQSRRSSEVRRPQSASGSVRKPLSSSDRRAPAEVIDDDDSALAPRPGRHHGPPAGQSRLQQKLNLQRASSVIEQTQSIGGGMPMGNVVGLGVPGANSLVGGPSSGTGYDGSPSRDPRVAKLLERTGVEYLSVRRYQNPVVRSLDRVVRMQEAKKLQRIPPGSRTGGATVNGNYYHAPSRAATGHARNVSLGSGMPSATERRPVTPRAQSIRTLRSMGGASSFEAEDVPRNGTGSQGLSGSSLVGGEDEKGPDNGLNAALRNLWEKSMDLSASQD